MCGIFGAVVREDVWSAQAVRDLLSGLFLLSESRGREAAGLAIADDSSIRILKAAEPASTLIRSSTYRNVLSQTLSSWGRLPMQSADGNSDDPNGSVAVAMHAHTLTLVGHSRLVTDGTEAEHDNNQPVAAKGVVGVHNGIVVNDEDLWQRHSRLERDAEVDSEVLFKLLVDALEQGSSVEEATRRVFGEIQGMASIAAVFDRLDCLLLATNNGSLYTHIDDEAFVFASERYILDQLLARKGVRGRFATRDVQHLEAGHAIVVDLRSLSCTPFELTTADVSPREPRPQRETPRTVVDATRDKNTVEAPTAPRKARNGFDLDSWVVRMDERFPSVTETEAFKSMRRCTRCTLPETMPFIRFDDAGVCNFCRDYEPLEFHGREAFVEAVEPFRRKDGGPECIVGVSGGRDSCYALHFVKNELGLNPLAYTYDWGMVTDLARRNISRMCGKLGIEHILVSADIPAKRRNIRLNVEAWLRRPKLGMIPLFMAGDKQYFLHAQRLKEQTGARLQVFGENMLERTNFKTGYAGVPPAYNDRNHAWVIPFASKFRLMAYYGREYLLNPRYINVSLLDTLDAFRSYYFLDRAYLNLFKYMPWYEDEVVGTLRRDYDWELATDTESTWRIGDGTSPFYNYIYLTVAGFTENDSFRSNQVREGIISRDEALELAARDNKPRWESIRWYLETIGIQQDVEDVIETINRIPKRF